MVAARYTATGTQHGEFLLVEPTGAFIETLEMAMYRFDSGKIVEIWTVANDLRILSQIGGIEELWED